MSAAAITADADVDLLDDPMWIFDCTVPQLKAAWKQLDQSGFEPASNKHLRHELMKRAYYKAFAAEQVSTSARDEDETSLPSPSDSATKASPPPQMAKRPVSSKQSCGVPSVFDSAAPEVSLGPVMKESCTKLMTPTDS